MNRTLLFVIVFLSAPLARAHHGAGTFDLSKTIQLSGKLTRVDLINPHSWLYFESTGKDGKVSRYRCEMRSVHVLRRSGWDKELFPIGQQIHVEASPDRVDPNSCYLQTILFENGSRMDRYGQYVKAQGGVQEVRGPLKTPPVNREARRTTGEPNLAGDWASEQMVMVDPRGVGGGLVRLSLINQPRGERAGGGGARAGGQAAGPRLYGGTALTDAGEKAAAAFAREDNPRFRCETTSIIFDWPFDGAVNRITQSKDEIVLQYGQFGFKRTVYLNLKTHPPNIKPSRAGHSIGRWDGDVLVVDTVGFSPGVLNAPVRNSDKLHVVERFSLDPKTMALTRNYEADDAAYLKGKYTGLDVMYPADAPYAPGRCEDLTLVNYSKTGQK